MDVVRYRPGEAIRWLEVGAEDLRKEAKRKGTSLVQREGERTIGKDLMDAAGAIFGMGKSAWADLMHKEAQASEYILHDGHFDVVKGGLSASHPYKSVRSMRQRGDRVSVVMKQGSVAIKPHAHILAGRLKVPIGWNRNGMEVPYETLLDELSARCGVEIEHV